MMLTFASSWLRWLTLASGLVECLCFAGLFLGWASLVFVLKAEGYFSDLCFNSTGDNSSVVIGCHAQDAQLSLVFTIAMSASSVLLLPMGLFLDKWGTMAARIFFISIYTTGSLLMAFSSSELPLLVFPAMACLTVTGMSLFATNTQTSNLFGPHRSVTVSLLSGMMGSSPLVLLVIKVLYENGISLRASFLFISACSVIHLLRTFLLLPKTHIPYPLPEDYTYGMSCCGQSKSMEQKAVGTTQANGNVQREVQRETSPSQSRDRQPSQQSSGNGPSFRSCVLSRFFLFHLLWFSVCRFNVTFLFVAFNSNINLLAEGNTTIVSRYTNAFAFAQLCGALCAPWNGLIIDRLRGKLRAAGKTEREADLLSCAVSLFITSLLSLLFSICASIPVLPLQYLTFALQVISASFLFSGHAVFISTVFPTCFYGMLNGISYLASIILLLHYPLMILITTVLQGASLFVFVGITLLTLITFIHPLNIYLHCRRQAADHHS